MENFDEISKDVMILKELEIICKMIADRKYWESNQIWYNIIKPVVVKNVGNLSSDPKYRSSEWYDCVYHHLAKTLGI